VSKCADFRRFWRWRSPARARTAAATLWRGPEQAPPGVSVPTPKTSSLDTARRAACQNSSLAKPPPIITRPLPPPKLTFISSHCSILAFYCLVGPWPRPLICLLCSMKRVHSNTEHPVKTKKNFLMCQLRTRAREVSH
jgi:hypothetical protein